MGSVCSEFFLVERVTSIRASSLEDDGVDGYAGVRSIEPECCSFFWIHRHCLQQLLADSNTLLVFITLAPSTPRSTVDRSLQITLYRVPEEVKDRTALSRHFKHI